MIAGRIFAAGMLFVLAACAQYAGNRVKPLTASERSAMLARGHDLAAVHCGGCHAIGRDDNSPRADAAPLRSAVTRHDSSYIQGNLTIGVPIGHPDMPLFRLNPNDADALAEYLKSIRTPDH